MTFFCTAAMICGCSQNASHKMISTLPSAYQLNELKDCMVAASFNVDKFNWMGGNLTMEVYEESIYDAVDICRMAKGDTLLYDGENMLVESVEQDGDYINVNGGLDNGGAWLTSNGGGTFRAVQFDDHSIYTKLGEVQLPLSEDFLFIDCGNEYTDPSDTVSTGQKLHLESLEGYRKEFSPLNTTVLIENGTITEINRRWIP